MDLHLLDIVEHVHPSRGFPLHPKLFEVGILQLTDDNTVYKFANGKKDLTVPFEQHPYAALAQYFKTDEGVDLMKSITKKLS